MQLTEASVLVPLYRSADGELRLVFIRRSEAGAQGGQLAFPGGKRDESDSSLLDTALREAREEVGIHEHRIEILAALPPIETKTSNFRVFPFVGRVILPVAWQRNEREVAEIFDVSLLELVKDEVLAENLRPTNSTVSPQRAPYYRVGQYQLWGLSYRILSGLVPRLIAQEWKI